MDYDAPTPRSFGSGSPRSPLHMSVAPYNPAHDINVSNSVMDSISRFQERKACSGSGVLSPTSSSASAASLGPAFPLKKVSNSVEDFFLLVNQGVISAPAENLLSRPLIRNGSASSTTSNSSSTSAGRADTYAANTNTTVGQGGGNI